MQNRSKEVADLALWSVDELKSALKENPNLINEQDENGMTILHYAAKIGFTLVSTSAREILNELFNSQNLDFTIKNKSENTPLHLAALCCEDRVTCEFVFPAFVKEAARRGFDFSTLGQQGQSVLHIATRTSYTDARGIFGRINNVLNVLKNAANPGLDVISSSGSTAFYYAVNFCHFAEANALLDAGANPMLYGNKERDPLSMIDQHLQTFSQALLEIKSKDSHDCINAVIDELNELKKRVLEIAKMIRCDEIKKNASLLAQGTIFRQLPNQLIIKPEGDTRALDLHTQEEPEQILESDLQNPHL